MTNEKILQKAIEKAIDNGYKPIWNKELEGASKTMVVWSLGVNLFTGEEGIFIRCGRDVNIISYRDIIFNPEFAKAFWGLHDTIDNMTKWRYHQHKLLDIIQEGKNPLKYIEKFLKI